MMVVMRPNSQVLRRWYDRFGCKPGATGYHGDEGRRYFYRSFFIDSLYILEFDFGLIRLTDYIPGIRIVLHALFDSHKVLRAKEELLEAARWIFDTLDVERIEAGIPASQKSLGRLLESLNFKSEGLLRKAYFNGTIYGDKAIYSLIKEDIGYVK